MTRVGSAHSSATDSRQRRGRQQGFILKVAFPEVEAVVWIAMVLQLRMEPHRVEVGLCLGKGHVDLSDKMCA